MKNVKKVRYAVRAVVSDQDNKFALLNANNGEHYKIPGGGIDESETPEEALNREVKEETGCEITVIEEIGEYEFESSDSDRKHHSFCYLAKVKGEKGKPNFDDYEKKRKFKLVWIGFDDAIKLLEQCKPQYPFNAKIVKRDLYFLKEARKYLAN